jgi:hypothetical protein
MSPMEAEIETKGYFVLHKNALHYRQFEAKLTSFVEGACNLQMKKKKSVVKPIVEMLLGKSRKIRFPVACHEGTCRME